MWAYRRGLVSACCFLLTLCACAPRQEAAETPKESSVPEETAPQETVAPAPSQPSSPAVTEPSVTTGETPALCIPQTCVTLRRNCGPASDGCGANLNCGTCLSPQTCGGGGLEGICGGGGVVCAPETDAAFCARLLKDCGSVTERDNCSVTRTAVCGVCTRAGEICGGSGTPNVCGGLHAPPPPPPCTPAARDVACRDQDCGAVDDGCWSLIDCGTCSLPAVCDTEHDAVYPTNVCRFPGDPTERCTPITGGSGLFRCALGGTTYCRELLGRVRSCPGAGPTCGPIPENPRITRCVEGSVGWCQTSGTTIRVDCPAPPPAAGTINVGLRASNGDLLLYRGGSEALAWLTPTGTYFRFYRVPMSLAGPPTLLYQPESKGAPPATGGRVHVFGRTSENRLAYRWCDVNGFRERGEHNCQGPPPLAFPMTDLPSVVLLRDGSLFGFYRGTDGHLAYFKGRGGLDRFWEGRRILDALRDPREAGRCGGITYSPSAVLRPPGESAEEINVFANDGAGHLIRAFLPNAGSPESRWRCEIFNQANSPYNTGTPGLGSSPVAIFNERTREIDILGMRHPGTIPFYSGGNYPTLWMSGTDRTSGRMYLQPPQSLSIHPLNYTWSQPLGVAIQHGNTPNRTLHVFYRTGWRRHLGYAYLLGDGRLGYELETLDTIDSPAAIADPPGNLHLFFVEPTRMNLIHQFKSFDSESRSLTGDDPLPELTGNGVAASDNAPAVAFSPEPFPR